MTAFRIPGYTSEIEEDTNLYFTPERAQAAVSGTISASHARGHLLLGSSDHTDIATYLDQPLLKASSPTFADLTSGAYTMSALGAASHAKAHTLLSADHTDIATYLNQALLTTSLPTFDTVKATNQLLIGASADFADTYGPHALFVQSAEQKNALVIGNATRSVLGAFYVGNDASQNAFQFGTISNDNFGFFTNNGTPQLSLNVNGGAVIGTNANTATPPANGLAVSGDITSDSTVKAATGLSAGIASPIGYLHICTDNVSTAANASNFDSYGSTASWAQTINMRRGRGTGAIPAAILTSDRLGGFLFSGHDGTSFGATAAVLAAAAEGFTSSARGTYLTFEATPLLSTVRSEVMRLASTGLGIGITNITARLHIKAGTATANTAPIKLVSGVLNTTAEVGAIEFLSDKFYATITTGAARKEYALCDTALTSGKYPKITTNGRLTDGPTPLAGSGSFYVSATSGGSPTVKIDYTDGIITGRTP